MAKGSTLRVAVVGTGMISQFHFRGWEAVEGAAVVAVCDTDRDKAAARAREFGIDRIYTDVDAMFDDGGIDAVDIAASVDAHAPIARAAADRGIHVMCQKPLTRTVREAEALVADVGERVRFMVHENYRFRPHYRIVRDWIEQGRIGEPRHAAMTVRCSGLVSLNGETPFLVDRQPYLTGFDRNIVFETMIHHLDIMRCTLGPLKVVSAVLGRINMDLPGEDTATIVLRGEGGLVAVADGTLTAPGYQPLPADRYEVIGTTGTLVMDFDRIFLVGKEDEAEKVDLVGRYQECFTEAVRQFVAGIVTGEPFETDRLDNLETLRLMESVYNAAGIEV